MHQIGQPVIITGASTAQAACCLRARPRIQPFLNQILVGPAVSSISQRTASCLLELANSMRANMAFVMAVGTMKAQQKLRHWTSQYVQDVAFLTQAMPLAMSCLMASVIVL